MKAFILTILVFCGCAKAPPELPPQNPPQEVIDEWKTASDRLAAFAPDGFVISLKEGVPQHQGDSLIFTGIALASVPCASGDAMEHALVDMLKTKNGALYRHPTIPNDVSLDGALGFYLGVAHRLTHCGALASWKDALRLHSQLAGLSPAVSLDEPWRVVKDEVLHAAGIGGEPSQAQVDALTDLVGDWAEVVKLSRAACYRVHIGFLAMQTLEVLGRQVPRDKFCAASAGTDLPVVDHYCGRDGLKAWLDGFKPNLWEYRHQRCPAWESADGNDMDHPEVDYLKGLVDQYAFKESK